MSVTFRAECLLRAKPSGTKSLNTSIDVSMTWQESNSHFFPPSVSVTFAPLLKFHQARCIGALSRGIYSKQVHTNSFWFSSSGFSYLLPVVVDLNIARTLDAARVFWVQTDSE